MRQWGWWTAVSCSRKKRQALPSQNPTKLALVPGEWQLTWTAGILFAIPNMIKAETLSLILLIEIVLGLSISRDIPLPPQPVGVLQTRGTRPSRLARCCSDGSVHDDKLVDPVEVHKHILGTVPAVKPYSENGKICWEAAFTKAQISELRRAPWVRLPLPAGPG